MTGPSTRGLLIVALLAAWAAMAMASEPATAPQTSAEAELSAAVEAYRNRDFARATELFAALAASEADTARSALLLANAGTSAARREDFGEAVWYLRAARRLAPRDRAIRVNLERVMAMVGDGAAETSHFTDTLMAAPRRLTPGETERVVAMAAGLGLLLAAAWRAWSRRWLGTLALLCIVLPLGGLAWSRAVHAAADREAVVIPRVASVRSEPQDDGKILFRLSGGTLVHAVELRGDWRLVQIVDEDVRGWIPADQARPLP